MFQLLETILKVISELTFRRFISLILFLVVFMFGFVVYERVTSSFSLNRIQKSTELLSKLTDLRSHKLDPESKTICDKLVLQLQKSVDSDPLSLSIVSTPFVLKTELLWKFLFGGAAWFIMALFNMPKALRRDKVSVNNFFVLFGVGCLFGAIGLFIPSFLWPYFHLLVYPFLIIMIFLVIGLIAALKTGKPK